MQTVFWDKGFIILNDDKIVLHSVQSVGRIEICELVDSVNSVFTFNSLSILNDSKSAIKSQRVFSLNGENLHYEMNMATKTVNYQNHLKSDLRKINLLK